jgi:NAD(P)-dependent dehydrogenase (short-subunit alcohol dehydrogenase family)
MLKLGEAALTFPQEPDHIRCPRTRKQMHALTERTVGRRRRHLAFASLDDHVTYQMVSRFYSQGADWRIVLRAHSICVAMKSKHKQTALITGASSGIGLGLTKGFLAAGFNVVANSRHVMTAGTLTPSDDLLLVDGDVGEVSAARNLVKSAERRFRTVDVLINNAGIFVPKPFVEYTPEDFERVMSTNVAGFFYVSQEAVRLMQQNGGGQIITISTTLAQQPVAGVNAALTSLTKGGLNSVTRGLAIEYAASGIRVNAIAPGIVDTPMHDPENHKSLKNLHPIARLATVQEIVDAALFLVGAPFITGEVIHVDGGAHAGRW